MRSDNAYLQTLLDAGGEVVFPSVNPATGTHIYDLAEPLVLHNTFILMSNVDGFAVEGLHFTNPRYWNMTFHYCANGTIRDIVFDSANNAEEAVKVWGEIPGLTIEAIEHRV